MFDGFGCVALLFVDLAKTETCAIRIIRMTLWAFSNHSLPFQISGKRISTNKEKSNIQRDEEEMESGLTFCLLSIDSISIKEILQVGLMNQTTTLAFFLRQKARPDPLILNLSSF